MFRNIAIALQLLDYKAVNSTI